MQCPYDPAASGSQPVGSGEQIVGDERAQLDFSTTMSYGDYLQLDKILNAQVPLSPDHNELLFIIQHQTSELWMKLLLHEVSAATREIAAGRMQQAFKMLARVTRVMEQLVHAWDVLATMTPPEYTSLRPYLKQSSGFQSYQYRCIEFSMGNKNAAMLKPHEHRPDLLAMVRHFYESPSLYDQAIRCLHREGIAVPEDALNRDWTQPYAAHDGVRDAWLVAYRDPDRYWSLYQLGEKLTDIEDSFRLWRYRHMTTVERVIGFKRGTGGTGGVSYLRKMLDVVLFPELWNLRTEL